MSEISNEGKEAKKAEPAAASNVDLDSVKKELSEKLALEQELAKYKAKVKETESKLNETVTQFQDLSSQLDELKKRNMSKEELEAEEKRKLASENEKLKQTATDLQKQIKEKTIEISRVKIAHEENIPSDLMEMVTGETDEEIRHRAKKLSAHIKSTRQAETVVLNQVKEVGTETTTKEGVQNQTQQPGAKKPQNFNEAKAALYKKFSS